MNDEQLTTLLRQGGLPEPSAWFSARTLARLRHERLQPGWFLARFRLSLLRIALCLLMVTFALAGWHLKAQRDNQKLTFSALEAVAQGAEPGLGEEDVPWSEAVF